MPPPPTPAFDVDAITRVRRVGGDELLHRLIGLYVETTRQRLGDLQACVGASELPGIARAAHSIRGSAGNLGALSVMQTAAEVESAALAARAPDLPRLVAALEQALAAAEAHFAILPSPDQ